MGRSNILKSLGLMALLSVFLTLALFRLVLVSPTTASKEMAAPAAEPVQPASFWKVHLYAIPGSDATTLNMAVQNMGSTCQGDIVFNAEYKGSVTPVIASKDPGADRYVAVLPDFFPGCTILPCTTIEVGTLEVTCNQPQLASRTVNFRRYYAPSGGEVTIVSNDNAAQLQVFPTSLSAGQYVIVMPSNASPGVAPQGVKFVSEAYSFRPSGLLSSSDENMGLSIDYSSDALGAADPLTVRMYEWDLVQRAWLDTSEQNNFSTGGTRISKPTKNFTTYALGTSPLWCDSFYDTRGFDLNSSDNIIRLLADGGKLKLENTTLPGSAFSKPYTPSMEIQAWATVSYTAEITAGASMTVSVVSQDGSVLEPNVSSGQSLAGIDPAAHPSLKLRVDMSTSGASPELFDWCLLAEPAKPDFRNVYLPMIVK